MPETVTREEVLAFRLHAHGLTTRSPRDGLPAAAGRCGIQDSPPGSALLALHARVEGLTRAQVDVALGEDRMLLRTWCMRGAPFVVPVAEAAVFTTGVLPPTEEAGRHLVTGVEPALDALGMSLGETVALVRAEIGDVLSARRLAVDELGAEISRAVVARLSPEQRDRWTEEGPYSPGQPLGEAVVHFCLRLLTLEGAVCFAPRAGGKAPFVLLEEWLGHPLPEVDPVTARAELVRRYLRCYGPTDRAGLAGWLGVRVGDTGPWWDLVEDELAPVGFRGTSWVLAEDLGALRSPPAPSGVRLLPPRDPYTQARDRDTLLAQEHHREVWRATGEPGTVLVDGRITGTWRPRRRGRRLTVAVTTFGRLAPRHLEALRVEAEQVASLRGAASVSVELVAT